MIARAKLESWHLESWNNQVKLEKKHQERVVQTNLYKTTTLGTTQKWLSYKTPL